VVGALHPQLLAPLLSSLAALRASHNFSLTAEVDGVVGKAISVAGPRMVLQAIPLNITGQVPALLLSCSLTVVSGPIWTN